MDIFIKKIQSQEWGYSGDVPNSRGKYILIPKIFWDFFPDLSISNRNSFCSIRIRMPDKTWAGLFYVWHNTKFFPEVNLARHHDERRLYSAKYVEEKLNLDRNVFIVFAKSDDDGSEFFGTSILQDTPEYRALLEHFGDQSAIRSNSDALQRIIPETIRIVQAESLVNDTDDQTVQNPDEIMDAAKSRLITHLGSPITIVDDPLMALISTFKTQSDFSAAVRKIYNNTCALRESYIYRNYPIGLEAAHIHARYNGGNYLPSNGILLSTDLHRAFDDGLWTLSDDLKVIIHEDISEGILIPFRDKKLFIAEQNKIFQPFNGYVKWHRENRFGFFKRYQQQNSAIS